MAEQVTLQPPITGQTKTDYRIERISLRTLPAPFISIELLSNTGERLFHNYDGQPARQMLSALNRGNFTTTSFTKTVLNKLIADGVITGSVTGTPE